jgi:hypothetical protein
MPAIFGWSGILYSLPLECATQPMPEERNYKHLIVHPVRDNPTPKVVLTVPPLRVILRSNPSQGGRIA